MNNNGMNKQIWTSLRQRWAALEAAGHTVKIEFNVLKDPHYYVLNAILEKMSWITRDEYSGLQLHRDRGDGRVYFRFLTA